MIPDGWETTDLGSLSSAPITYGVVKPGPSDDKDGVLFVRGGDFPDGKINPASLRTITKKVSNQYRRTKLKGGEVLISLVGYPGACAVVPPELAGANIARQAAIIRPKKDVTTSFLVTYLRSPLGQANLLSNVIGSAQQVINLKDLRNVKVPLPPAGEREAIADVAQTWDRAIETVEALIANARAQKQALMQQLLPQGTTPPKKRLPGLSGDWKRVVLSEVGTISSAGVDKKVVEGETEIRLLNFLDAYNREFIYDTDLKHAVTAPKAKTQGCNVRKGDVFFTPSSETRDDIALAAVAAEDMPGVAYSYHVVRFRPTKQLDLNFSAFVFQADDFKRQAYRLGDGSGQRYVISQSNFRKMHVSLPGIDEQAAIGSLLADHSTAIADYQAQLTALRQEKAALMQQLLTGKRRVKLPDSEVV